MVLYYHLRQCVRYTDNHDHDLLHRIITLNHRLRKIKQFELAEYLEIEPTNLSKIENGVYLPREDKLRKIASKLNVEIKDLFDAGHFQDRKTLLSLIRGILNSSSDSEIIFYYKFLKSYKELK